MKRLSLTLCLISIISVVFAVGMQGRRYADEAVDYYQRGNYQEALRYFLLADKAASGNKAEYHYWIGKSYLALDDTLNAKKWFAGSQLQANSTLNYMSRSFLEIMEHQNLIFTQATVVKLPNYINSRNSDFAPIITPDGRYLYFTSLRPADKDKENIWRCEKLNNSWGQPTLVKELSTDKNESIGSFSPDGKTAYLTGNYQKRKLDGEIYQSTYDKKWSTPVSISELRSNQYDAQPMIFEDSLLFFVSSREGGMGNSDIYLSILKNNQWSEPINLGAVINTAKNEQTPFLDWDRKTLFFASEGHTGFGGYDIFKAVRLSNNWTDWSIPENLGNPINSVKNDRYFYHVKNSTDAYFSSDRGSEGFENLYSVSLTYAPRQYVVLDPASGKKSSILDSDKTSPINGIDNTPPPVVVVHKESEVEADTTQIVQQPIVLMTYETLPPSDSLATSNVSDSLLIVMTQSAPADTTISELSTEELAMPSDTTLVATEAPIAPADTTQAEVTSTETPEPIEEVIPAKEEQIVMVDAHKLPELRDTTSMIIPDTTVVKKPYQSDKICISGSVTDEKNKPLKVLLEFFYNLDDKRLRAVVYSNPDGTFSLTVPRTKQYDIDINQEGYFKYSETVPAGADSVLNLKPIVLNSIQVKKIFVFNNIQFFFDSAMLLKEDLPTLNEIVLTMLNNPNIKVEISGHTCDIGKKSYNQKLSERRAKEVRMYLILKGVTADRITAKGYGESKPLKSNKSKLGRRLNRRVEVKVIE